MDTKGHISKLYNIFMIEYKESSDTILQSWISDLSTNITKEEWIDACSMVRNQSVNSHSILLQYKWLTRQYITPAKLHRFDPRLPDRCIKCNDGQKGTLIHCIWECPHIVNFWQKVLAIIKHILGREIPLDPKLCILNILPDNLVISKCEQSLLIICLLEAKRCIARAWKNVSMQGTSEWLNAMVSNVALERISYFTKNKMNTFWKIWGIFYDYLKRNNIVAAALDTESF